APWFFFSSRRRHTCFSRDWSSDVCSSDLPASGFARRVRRRSGRSVRLRPVLGSLLPGSHPTTSTTTHPSPTASLTVQTRQNQGWPSCGSSQSRSRASENHTVAINITGPCDDQAVLHHEMGLTPLSREDSRPYISSQALARSPPVKLSSGAASDDHAALIREGPGSSMWRT